MTDFIKFEIDANSNLNLQMIDRELFKNFLSVDLHNKKNLYSCNCFINIYFY